MASELFNCSICGVQVRRVSDGENPLPETFDSACEEHLEEFQEQQAVLRVEEAKAAVQVAENALVDAKAHLADLTKVSRAEAAAEKREDKAAADKKADAAKAKASKARAAAAETKAAAAEKAEAETATVNTGFSSSFSTPPNNPFTTSFGGSSSQ